MGIKPLLTMAFQDPLEAALNEARAFIEQGAISSLSCYGVGCCLLSCMDPDSPIPSIFKDCIDEALYLKALSLAHIETDDIDQDDDREAIPNPTPERLWIFHLPAAVFVTHGLDASGMMPDGFYVFDRMEGADPDVRNMERRQKISLAMQEASDTLIHKAAEFIRARIRYENVIYPSELFLACELAQADNLPLLTPLQHWLPAYLQQVAVIAAMEERREQYGASARPTAMN